MNVPLGGVLVWLLRPVVRLYDGLATVPGTPCFWCYITLHFPRWLAEPPLWAWRDRKVYTSGADTGRSWWDVRDTLYRRYLAGWP